MQEWEKRLKHARDYRDLTVRLGFATAPKAPDPEGGLTPSGPVRRVSDKVFWPAWESLGHTHIDFKHCECKGTRL